MTWVAPRRSDSFHAVQLERVRSWLCGVLSLSSSRLFCQGHQVPTTTTATPRPSMLTLSATTPPLFALFASFVTLSSRHPSRATLTRRLVASVGCVRCPPFPLAGVLKLQALHRFLLFFPHDTVLGVPPGCPGGSARGFLSRLMARIILSEFFFFRFRYGLCGHPSLHIRLRWARDTLGWRPLEQCSYPPPPPSPSDDLRPPPPTVVAESQWGEPRSGAFGTGARVAGSISVWPVLLPLVGNR
jgi:hypothetical protein